MNVVELSSSSRLFLDRQREVLAGALKQPDTTYLVVPSISVAPEEIRFIERAIIGYEHRLLWLLNRALTGRRVIFVSSMPASPLACGHMLTCAAICGHGSISLETICLEDGSTLPLAEKILSRPDWLERLRRLLQDGKKAVLVPFMGTDREFRLGQALGIPVIATPGELSYLGTKSGSRKIFRRAGLDLPEGLEDLRDEPDLVDAAESLWLADPTRRRLVAKVNEGISGYGNAVIRLPAENPSELSSRSRRRLIAASLTALEFQTSLQDRESFMSRFATIGGVIEAFIEGGQKSSPSGQGFIHPNGPLELLSTHEQILHGPDGMVFEGAVFPALRRRPIGKDTLRVGEILQEEGALAYFGVDFLEADGKRFAIEINLRQGGTTHLRAEAMIATGAQYESKSGHFLTASGKRIFYAGTDSVIDIRLTTREPDLLLEHFSRTGLLFSRSRQEGVIFHLLDSMSRYGCIGFTAVAGSRRGALSLFKRARREIDRFMSPRAA